MKTKYIEQMLRAKTRFGPVYTPYFNPTERRLTVYRDFTLIFSKVLPETQIYKLGKEFPIFKQK